MTIWTIAAILGLIVVPSGEQRPEPATDIPPARDGNVAIRQELDAARKAGTIEAYDLFIARHPDHPLAEIARCERESLARRRR
jgi:hypothetical protein